MLAICAALQWETRPALRALTQVRRIPVGATPVWQGHWGDQTVLVFRTGIGTDHAATTTQAMLDHFPVTALINTGCAGGLAPHLSVGSLVIPSVLMAATGAAPVAYPTDSAWTDALRSAAQAARLPADHAPLLTTSAALTSATAKRAAHDRFQAAAVDMEGSAVAALAAQRHLPFATARVILDDAGTALPDVDGLAAADGSLRPLAAAKHVIFHPSHLPVFLRLSGAARQAEKTLELLFRAFFAPDSRKDGLV